MSRLYTHNRAYRQYLKLEKEAEDMGRRGADSEAIARAWERVELAWKRFLSQGKPPTSIKRKTS